jgi:hypothetical protein
MSDIDPSTLSDALSELIAFDSKGRAVWPAKQLETMLWEPLGKFGVQTNSSPETRSARELLEHPTPSIELLIAIKGVAKRHSKDLLPPEMALLLYYGSIAAAMVRCGQRITKLRDDDLRNGFTWAIKQPWVPENIRELFRAALAKSSSGQKWRE